MKVEIELPPLPVGWASGPVEIGYGVPPAVSWVLADGEWCGWRIKDKQYVYALRKWQPAIVTAGVLSPGWVVIDANTSCYHSSGPKPQWNESTCEWRGFCLSLISLRESPQVTGRNAIWEIK
jgi:hypothetical protein